MRWLALCHPFVYDYAYHIPNEGKRSITEAMRLKNMGLRAGIPDICIALDNDINNTLYIEFKYGKNVITLHQETWIKKLREAGHRVAICYTIDEAMDVVLDYFKNTDCLGRV